MEKYYFSATWAGLEDGTVVNVVGGGTATIGTNAFASSYGALMKGGEDYGEETYGEEWVIATCDVYVDKAYAGMSAGDPIALTVVNPDDPSETYDIPGVLTYGTDALGSDATSTASECLAILNSARTIAKNNGVGAIVVTDINGNSTYAFGSLTSTGGFFANGVPVVINGGTFSSSNTGVSISGAGANATVNDGNIVSNVTINGGSIGYVWAGGANGVIAETNLTLNGGSVNEIAGGYSGTIGTANYFVYGGNFNQLLTTYGSNVNNANILIDTDGGTVTGYVSITGRAAAQATRLTGNFHLTVRDTTMTKGVGGNRGGTLITENVYMEFINSSVGGTVGIGANYGGINCTAEFGSYVISVDGSNMTGRVDGTGITMTTENKRTIRATGANSTIANVYDIDAFVIDADTCLTVTNLANAAAKAASITIDATGYEGTEKAVFVANYAPTGTYAVLENGTASSRYSVGVTGGTVFIKAMPAIFSVSWTGLPDGTEVQTKGGIATIGTNAFATYAEAAASGYTPITGDIYLNNEWTAGEDVDIFGYTATVNDTYAFNTIAGARNAYSNRMATDGAIYVVGGTYNDASGTGQAQTQYFNGYKTLLEGVVATTIIAGMHNTNCASTDMTVKDSTVTLLSGGARANGLVTDTIKINISGSTVSEFRVGGAGLGTTEVPATAEVTVTGSSVGTINAGGSVYGDIVLTITGSTIKYLGAAGQGDSNVFTGDMTFNLTDAYISKMYSNRGINTTGGIKGSYVQGDVVINVGGTTTIAGDGAIGYASSNSTTINLAADSLLKITGSSTLASYVAITINVDGYTGTGEKLVLTGKNTSSNTISITGENADKYGYKRDGNDLYLVKRVDGYFSIGWSDLEVGDVVTVAGGTAIIGTNAFATYDAAVAAVGEDVRSADVYFSYDWTGASAGDVVDVTTPGGTFSATIGDNAFATLSSALSAVDSDGYVHVVGGSVELAARVGLLQKDVWFTNTVITQASGSSQGDLCGVYGNATAVTDGKANVVIGEGSYVQKYYVSRGNFSGDAVVTVRDGGRVSTLFGGPTSAALTGGSTTINVINGGTAGTINAVSSGTNSCAAYINIIDSYAGNVMGSATATASNRTGDLFINISGSTVNNVQSNSTGTTDITGGTLSINIANSKTGAVSLNNGTIINNGTVDVNITGSTITSFSGPVTAADDVSVNITGSTVGVSVYNVNTGVFGAVSGSLVDSVVGSYYFGMNAGTATSLDLTMSGSTAGTMLQGVAGASTIVSGDVNITMNDSRGSFHAAGGATVGGDLNVTFNGGTYSEFRTNNGADIAGAQNVTFASGTTTISTFKTIYNSGADLVIADGATLVINEADSFALNSFTVNGELVLTASNYADAVTANGFVGVTVNAAGTGTVTIGELATGAVVSSDSDNTLYAYLLEQPVVYVNADWTEQVANHTVFTYDSKSLLGGVSAFTSADDAKAFAGADTEIVLVGFTAGTTYYGDGSKLDIQGGSYKALVAGERIEAAATITTDTEITFESGTASFIFGGTYIAAGGDATISGDSTATISGGEFDKFVCGGNVVATGGSVTLSGDSTLNISGGVFSGVVAGGSDSQGGKITTTSDYTSNLNITGGTFNRIFGGNVASKLAYASFSGVQETLIDINGSTNVSIDSSANNIVINGDIVAGSYGVGQITGDTSITFKGLGDNLDFSGKVSGDSQNAGTYDKCVSGTRSLVFDNFSGSFSGNIRGIDSVSFSNGSAVVFDDSVKQFYLKYASEWNFGAGTSLTWTNGINDFGGDTMNLTFNDLDSEWTVFTGSASTLANFDDMSVKFNGGASLSYDEGISGYSDGSYALTIDSDNSIVKLAKLA